VTPLSHRARSILLSVVTEFVATATPVGSRTLTKKYGFALSPATVRNVLRDLEDAGYLTQPHTSAGRVPTDRAFRLFIDALTQESRIPEDDAARIKAWLESLPAGADLSREMGKLLSDLSGAPAVVVRSGSEHRTLLKLRFILTRPGELLAVIVFSDGTVENRFIRPDEAIAESDLDRVHNMLEEVSSGKTLAALREHFAAHAHEARDALAGLHGIGLSLVRAAAKEASRGVDLVIEGQARLLDRPEFGSVDSMKGLLRVLEDRERLVGLLDRTLAAREVRVFLGEEAAEMVGCPVSLVARRYDDDAGAPRGALGVIGPTRMDYPFVVPLVGAVADAMSEAIVRQRQALGSRSDPKR
jgi:heat-inducible transcriptional repressor